MTDSNSSFSNNLVSNTNENSNSRKPINWAVIVFAILGLIGFINASYLTVERLSGESIKCFIFSGCETVTTSVYANIGPVPISLIGAIFYLIVFVLAIRYLESRNEKILHILHYLALLAALFAVYLVIIQAFILGAFCFYCMISAVDSTLLFIIGFWLPKDSFFIGKKN